VRRRVFKWVVHVVCVHEGKLACALVDGWLCVHVYTSVAGCGHSPLLLLLKSETTDSCPALWEEPRPSSS
jgi:hypothetical protein